MKDLERGVTVEECHACGYGPVIGVRFTTTSGLQRGNTFELCLICWGSPSGNEALHPTLATTNSTILRTVAYSMNMVLTRLEAIEVRLKTLEG